MNLNFFKEGLSLTIFYSGIAKLFNIIILFSSSVILARYLEPSGFGNYTFAISLTSLLATISCAGVPTFITREVAKYNLFKEKSFALLIFEKSKNIVIFTSSLIVILSLLLIYIYSIVNQESYFTIYAYCIPLIPLYALSSVGTAAIKGNKKVLISILSELILKPLFFFLVILFLVFIERLQLKYVIYGNLCSSLVYFILVSLLLKKFFYKKNTLENNKTKTTKSLLIDILPFSGIALISFINIEFVTILLGYITTSENVAFFKCSNNIALLVAMPLNVIELVLSPYITTLYYENKNINLQKMIVIASFFTLITSVLPAIILLIFGVKIITILYGPQYIPAYTALKILVLSYFLVNIIGISMQLLYATEYHSVALRISVYGALATIALCLIMIPWLGTTGAAIALGGGKIFRATLFSFRAKKILNINTSIFG